MKIRINQLYAYLEMEIDSKCSTFAYTENKVFKMMERLYELQFLLEGSNFVTISKSCILHCNALINGK